MSCGYVDDTGIVGNVETWMIAVALEMWRREW
jgi:hypothetical protein